MFSCLFHSVRRLSGGTFLLAAALCGLPGAAAYGKPAGTPHAGPAYTASVARGQALYQAWCTRCHDLDTHGIGPAHRGVFGRLAGRAPGYDYSTGLKRASFRWNARTLDLWLADPDAFVTWQQMEFSVPEARDRADLIAYLRTLR